MTSVELSGLTVHYQLGPVTVPALEDINLTIEQGEFLAVIGRSGSGKTTLLDCIGLLLSPTSGTVRIDGVDTRGLNDSAKADLRASHIGFVFQDFNLIPSLDVLENTLLPLRYSHRPRVTGRQMALELLNEMGLGKRLDARPTQLSGGEQQRVALARALMNQPTLVLADEPTGEVDSETRAGIVALMKRINRDRGVTFVIVTHDLELARQARRVVRLRDGRISGTELDSEAIVMAG